MRPLFTLFVFSLILSLTSLATAGTDLGNVAPTDSSSKGTPSLRLAIWKSGFPAAQSDHSDMPALLTPVDSSPPTGADVPQNVPVEAVPAPTAVASGLLVLGGLAAVRIFRKFRLA
jgi:hypothetical protein